MSCDSRWGEQSHARSLAGEDVVVDRRAQMGGTSQSVSGPTATILLGVEKRCDIAFARAHGSQPARAEAGGSRAEENEARAEEHETITGESGTRAHVDPRTGTYQQ